MTMFRSPEFWSPQVYRAKLKTPLEFMASALRASEADVKNAAAAGAGDGPAGHADLWDADAEWVFVEIG